MSKLVPALPEALRSIRRRYQKTQADFAQMLGLTHGAISKYESGKARPSRSVLLLYLQRAEGLEKPALMNALGVDEDLREGWPAGELEAALRDFQEYLNAAKRRGKERGEAASTVDFAREAIAILREGRQVDPVIVEILRYWKLYGAAPKTRDVFQNVAAYLEVQLAAMKAKGKKKG